MAGRLYLHKFHKPVLEPWTFTQHPKRATWRACAVQSKLRIHHILMVSMTKCSMGGGGGLLNLTVGAPVTSLLLSYGEREWSRTVWEMHILPRNTEYHYCIRLAFTERDAWHMCLTVQYSKVPCGFPPNTVQIHACKSPVIFLLHLRIGWPEI